MNNNQPKKPAAALTHQSGGLMMRACEWIFVDCIRVLIKIYQNSCFYLWGDLI